MVDHLVLKEPVQERPLSDWQSIAVAYLGASSEIIEGPHYKHHVVHKGEGPTLLMYHGVGGHAETYARTLPAIAAAGYHVYAVDALFHGFSSKDGFPFDRSKTTELQAAAVVDLIDALGLERAHYEGESMGAGIGFEFGMQYPERANKIILNGAGSVALNQKFPPSLGPPMEALLPLSVAAVTDPDNYDNIAKRLHWLVHPDHPERITDEMVRIRQRLYQNPEINASMRNVFNVGGAGWSMPQPKYTEDDCRNDWKPEALVLWGDHNPGIGPDYGGYFADLIGAKFYEFKDAGHWPQWEKPDEYAQVIIQFLDS